MNADEARAFVTKYKQDMRVKAEQQAIDRQNAEAREYARLRECADKAIKAALEREHPWEWTDIRWVKDERSIHNRLSAELTARGFEVETFSRNEVHDCDYPAGEIYWYLRISWRTL